MQLPNVQLPTVQLPLVQLPTVQLPVLQLPAVQLPLPPALPRTAAFALSVASTIVLSPVELTPVTPSHEIRAPRSRVPLPRDAVAPPQSVPRTAAAWRADAAPVVPARAAGATRATRAAPRAHPRAEAAEFLTRLGFTTTPSSAAAGGGAGAAAGAGAGVTAALAIWILLELPGVAVLRLPAGRRGPRAPVDETRTRPG